MENLEVAVLITGGKDSALALYEAIKSGYKIKYLVTMIPQRADSWMFHYPNIYLASLFAEAVDIPHVTANTMGVKEKELEDLKKVLKNLDVSGVVSGAITSEYQKSRIDRVCRSLGLKSIAPLWHKHPVKLLEKLVNLRFEVIIVGVYAYGLDKNWLGKRLNPDVINELIELNKKFQISIVGEGGEYETLVLDAPYFKKKIQILDSEIVWAGQSGFLKIKKAKLIAKK
ncbi:TPA: TIGR00289 family protein [Candidatus Bathyarchaeota archaeon]|nr:TIGR00289 family protein [Candidatus Bathyarchaeota archaeon]